MLSGWKTAGHLACTHCAYDHDAYNLSHGGKTTWFDNHRKFLPANHPFRKNKNWFTKGKTVTESPPPVRTASTFFSHYFRQDVHTKHRKVPRNDSSGGEQSFGGNISIFSHPGRSHGSVSRRYLDDGEYMAAHNYILFNCPEVAPYTEYIFINRLRDHNPYITSIEVDQCLESDFAMWFKHYAQDPSLVPNEYIRDISVGPLRSVKLVTIYYVNGYKFHTREYGADRSTFNSRRHTIGDKVVGFAHYASPKKRSGNASAGTDGFAQCMSKAKSLQDASPDAEGIGGEADGFARLASLKKRSGNTSAGTNSFAQIVNEKKHIRSANVGKHDGFAPNTQVTGPTIEIFDQRMSKVRSLQAASPNAEGISDKAAGLNQIVSSKKRSRDANAGTDGFAQIVNQKKQNRSANVSKHGVFAPNSQVTKLTIGKADQNISKARSLQDASPDVVCIGDEAADLAQLAIEFKETQRECKCWY
ncbi:hypothetical protein POM88_011202 [Heracleum sosnowskyi]|uniref:Uncharacterized protein n=1 Tax=Heracleum sosnowskyi TaxID=360622 RepID=A0AAD8N109_9APIA|nr:hypothetical protein POM88_011202 [Heracleum sosnowskyi]